MIISSPFVITLSAEEHQELTCRAHRARTAHRDVIRANIILVAADGWTNASIAADLGLHVDTVRKWRRRFCGERLAGLADRPRTGRPRRFSAVQVAEVKALACELPSTNEVPLAKWSCPDLATEAARRGVVESVSASTVRRWPAADALKPWQHRSWIFPRDPDFAVKAGRVLDLYARLFDGVPLGADRKRTDARLHRGDWPIEPEVGSLPLAKITVWYLFSFGEGKYPWFDRTHDGQWSRRKRRG